MAQHVQIPAFDEPIIYSVGSTPQSEFAIPFPFWGAADIRVWVDDALLSPASYSVEGVFVQNGDPVEGAYGSGTFTLNTAISNAKVALDRMVDPIRETDFGATGPLPIRSLNSDLDKSTARQQDLARWLKRVPTTAPGETPPTWEAVLTAAGLFGSAVGAIPVVPTGGDTAVPLNDWRGLVLPPEAFGALSSVFTTAVGTLNKTALTKAANAGIILDGGGRTYALNGRWDAPAAVQWRNIKFRQVATDGSAFNKTIVIDGFDDVRIADVEIDLNGIVHVSAFSEAHGLKIANCEDPLLKDVVIRNGTAMTGLWLEEVVRPRLIRTGARDFTTAASGSEPTDDVMQAVSLANVTDFFLDDCFGDNLYANWSGRTEPARLWSRGIAVNGSSNGVLSNCRAVDVDQGIDVTGSVGNKAIYIVSPRCFGCTTYAVKTANRNQYVFVSNGLVVDAGRSAYVVSSASSPTDPRPVQTKHFNCVAINTGSSGVWPGPADRYSFCVMSLSADAYPAGVDFINCFSYDFQATKTTDGWFAIRNVTESAPNSPIPPNRLVGCGGDGLAVGGTKQIGFDFASAKATGVGTQSVANGAIPTLQFSVDVYDPSNLIDTTNYRINAKEPGRYRVTASVKFINSATGRRELHLYKNGTETNARDRARCAVNSAADDTILPFYGHVNMDQGDYIEVRPYQNSGGALGVDLANSWVAIEKVHDLY